MITEDRLTELFATLPCITVDSSSYFPSFDFGSHEDLIKYMNLERKRQGGVGYPLVWVETPFKRVTKRNKDVHVSGLKFILATLTNSQLSNKERLETTIKPVLLPFYNDVIKALNYSGFTQIIGNKDKDISIHFNYGVDDKHQATDIWDAFEMELDLIITNRCLRTINY